mmetsp:Transcript_37161/g.102237  ORF Transcript_37161/g.102237 Transcript_37161/m.102237 type:complete len:262 (+) Transcript_37161:1712-2497(+)
MRRARRDLHGAQHRSMLGLGDGLGRGHGRVQRPVQGGLPVLEAAPATGASELREGVSDVASLRLSDDRRGERPHQAGPWGRRENSVQASPPHGCFRLRQRPIQARYLRTAASAAWADAREFESGDITRQAANLPRARGEEHAGQLHRPRVPHDLGRLGSLVVRLVVGEVPDAPRRHARRLRDGSRGAGRFLQHAHVAANEALHQPMEGDGVREHETGVDRAQLRWEGVPGARQHPEFRRPAFRRPGVSGLLSRPLGARRSC